MVSFAFGLFIGFGLGVLCMALLFLTRSSEAPTDPPLGQGDEQEELPQPLVAPSEAPSNPSVDR